jgi:hypothetical protein
VDYQSYVEVSSLGPQRTSSAHVCARVIAQKRLEASGSEKVMFMARIPTIESLTVDLLAFFGTSQEPRSNIRLPFGLTKLVLKIEDVASLVLKVTFPICFFNYFSVNTIFFKIIKIKLCFSPLNLF